MQSASSRIWTRVAESTSNHDIRYAVNASNDFTVHTAQVAVYKAAIRGFQLLSYPSL